ncbi:TRAP transporter small permease [Pseudogracilibacillus auburnensis]|uniref:TRAP transporter small permease n=1 Tax=Pseudogracilibacillus auburnensis TaxID=1494959 RepID=UPI001A974960|nr:TRAP transporter small permease subunit [Pseudogracilibacillus auburnensis]MBO1004894.1 TRAP transporter small permease [Pseudogracilibacillus auburnensis]
MRNLKRVNHLLQEFGGRISGIAILSMMFVIVLDVFLRNVFKTPIPGSYVIIENFLMPIAIFPALGYVYMKNILPRLSEFVARTPNWFQKYNKLLLLVMDIVVFGLLTYYTFLYFLDGFQQGMEIPIATKFIAIWPVYFFVPLGYFFVLLEVLIRFGEEIKLLVNRNVNV